jgi:ADP-ribose pyrophosphatase YjhB (NUDIX family)
MKPYSFCNNCGKSGHLFHQCKSPITSTGLIVFRYLDGVVQYLLIRRKDTLGYVDFIRGKYPITDKQYLLNIFSEMTIDEKDKLQNMDFSEMWKDLWGREVGIQYRGEEKASKSKFDKLKDGIIVDENTYSISSLIAESNKGWKEAEWGFPKGRRNYNEKDLVCALREFEEETGYKKTDVTIVQNVQPYEETFTGSNYKSYRHRYFLGLMKSIEPIVDDQHESCEVSKMMWGTYEECLSKIRPYNVEKIAVLQSVQDTLSRYSLYQ